MVLSGDISLGLVTGIAVAGSCDGLDRRGSTRTGRVEARGAGAFCAGGRTCRCSDCPRRSRPRRYWLDLGLVMFALYLAGCAVGSWLRNWVLSGHAKAT